MAERIFGHYLVAGPIYVVQAISMWPGAYERHVADKHIPKLRQFIEAEAT
jgi:hypothetical protein